MTPWQVLQIVMSGRPVRSAMANVRALRVSPRRWFFSWSTPAPVHEAPSIVSVSSSMSSRLQTSMVAA